MRFLLEVLAALAALQVCLAQSQLSNIDFCSPFTIGNSQFDLSPLKGRYYRIRDIVDRVERNYSYIFSVCRDFNYLSQDLTYDLPVACNATGPGFPPGPNFQDAPAYQVSRTMSNFCHRLGSSYINNTVALVDANPSKGFYVAYLFGDSCGNGKFRELNISFLCADADNQPEPRVFELSGANICHYSVEIRSFYACPLGCPIANRKLCGGNGFCQYDFLAGGSRCFCNTGSYGSDCSSSEAPSVTTSSSSSCDGTCGALIFVVILLFGLIVAAAVVLWHLRKSHDLSTRFGQLTQNILNTTQSAAEAEDDEVHLEHDQPLDSSNMYTVEQD